MAYVLPGELTNTSNFTSMIQYANTVSGESFGAMICIGVWLVVFIGLKNYDTGKALAAASFITTIFSIFMFILGMVSYYPIVLAAFLTALSSLYTLFTGTNN